TYPQLLVTKSAIRPGSNFNRQGGSIFHQRQHTKQPSENFDCTPKNSHLPASKQALLIIIKH
ncbi:hypothetical protein, partial [Pseudomonas aeruginosa]|uniref:hypothetical protein n=1 Tax=Pseudomonas aeruginosa TaxID=287 RepID=UPI001F04D2B3